jgi:uncharacterized protein (TIGR04551 family)
MSRLVAALAASLLLAGAPRAQEPKPEEKREAGSPELDPATRAVIQREVERAKEDIRNEVRAEIQGAQSAAEFLGAVAEGPKLEFLQLDGYFRVRGQLYKDLALGRPADTSGFPLFPRPLFDTSDRGTLATANMRLRFEPTLNISELVRVRAQLDILDNYVLGSSTSASFDDPFSPFPAPFYGSTRVLRRDDATADRDVILPKRVWAEVQTPVGLLSFGRMPSHWGLGVLANAGAGVDQEYGDTVDRIQFALPALQTPIGALTLVPMLDFDAEGVLAQDQRFGAGVGQPFDLESADDARTYAIKVARLDTEDEVRRKLERNDASLNFGAYYNYRTQRNVFPAWLQDGFGVDPTGIDPIANPASVVRRRSYGHVVDLWARVLTPRWRFEAEGAGVFGTIGQAFTVVPGTTAGTFAVSPMSERVLLRQWGGSFLTEYKAIPNKVTLGAELGVASGDGAPGFGNVPSRLDDDGSLPDPGALEGPQYGQPGDRSLRNFRFNPAYRVDLILFRQLLGQVTDAWYLKPNMRWDLFPGLALDAAVVYSQALRAASTPSAVSDDPAKPLGIELDTMLTYTSGSGFQAFAQWGILQPLDGFGPQDLSRAQTLGVGLVAKF